MSNESSRQERNVAGGDIAGRDITHHHTHTPTHPSTLRDLATKLRLDTEGENQAEFIAQLNHFAEPHSGHPSKDLEQKLRESAREDLLADALLWKEHFTKKLLRLQFSLQAQELFAHILSKIHTFFNLQVRPLVLAGEPRSEVDKKIYELIDELYAEVGMSELQITMTDLQGMVFFLAGNCHVDWK